MSKIGIFGGTFDPPHLGHLNIAKHAYDKLALDEFWFMPNGIPAYKMIQRGISSKEDRLMMLEILVKDIPWCQISRIEVEREGYTFTSDTLTWLSEKQPENDYYLIIGSDSYKDMHMWHDPGTIFKLSTIVVLLRGEDTKESLGEYTKKYISEYDADVSILENLKYDISSTRIREAVQNGKNTEKWIPNEIRDYILENKLYGIS